MGHGLMMVCKHLCISYGAHVVLDHLDLVVPKGALTVLIGPNGSGKSSLLRCLSGLQKPHSGTVFLDTYNLSKLDLALRARHIAYLEQERSLAWDLSVIEVVALGIVGDRNLCQTHIEDAIEAVGLTDKAETQVSRLSGGERARVHLARLWASSAQTWILDEPLNGLDPVWQRRALAYLQAKAASGHTIILSLHDLDLAAQFADCLTLIDHGRVVAQGKPDDVLTEANLSRVFSLKARMHDARLWVESTL